MSNIAFLSLSIETKTKKRISLNEIRFFTNFHADGNLIPVNGKTIAVCAAFVVIDLNNSCIVVATIRLLNDKNTSAPVSFFNSRLAAVTRRTTGEISLAVIRRLPGDVLNSSIPIANFDLNHIVNRSAPTH